MHVRTAEPRDSETIATLLRQLGYDRDPASIEADLVDGAAGDVIVATIDNRIAGVISLQIHRPFHRGDAIASIDALVVDETARSGGVGAALVDAAVQRAAAAHCAIVELHSNQDRTRARAFYERHGFRVTSNYFVRSLI